MPRVTPPQALDSLVDLIAAAPEGLGIEALSQALGEGMHRRTLQRRLAQLVGIGRIQPRGQGRAVRYVHAPTPWLPQEPQAASGLKAMEPPPADPLIRLSEEGRAVQAYVTQPRAQRRPVGYRLEFLASYRPNHTFYLPESLRRQLHLVGRSPAGQAPAGTFARDILNRLLIDLSWASSHLEGNTYTRLDTARLIERGLAAAGKDAIETQMILNHKQAIEFLVLGARPPVVDTDTVVALHAFLADGLMPDPTAVGRLRQSAVGIGGSVYLPLSLPQQVETLFGDVVRVAAEISDPFEQAFFLMVHLPYLQPFEDVNKRTSRLAANIPFIRHNLCPLSFIDVPPQVYVEAMLGVYELNRVELLRDVFVGAYVRSCQEYVAVQQNMAVPDLFRLRHRQSLAQAVAAVVRHDEAPTKRSIRRHTPPEVPRADLDRFIALVQAEFGALHAGNAVRFGIRPLALAAWQRKHRRSE